MRIGIGYDVHRMVKGRKLILGGVEVAFDKGLAGHSDSDVLTHAVCDAVLGAAALGDIGQHFPDNDPKWADADSLQLLSKVMEMVQGKGLRVAQIDTVIVAQEPLLGPYFKVMRERLAKLTGLTMDCVNVKAKTPEGLGSIGHGDAMAAHAIVLLLPQ
jgi:2-C-methyl-D-erythritol 2,4-cyclodiphosphate synthase